jgi:hypothetical protein
MGFHKNIDCKKGVLYIGVHPKFTPLYLGVSISGGNPSKSEFSFSESA